VEKTVREMTIETEYKSFSPYASFSDKSKGRTLPEEECSVRTAYQRDRDRIIHCNSFRRLKHKTQVFLSPEGDHYRTRLTHTLEVAQIARTIARALRLNEDLTEAIALGHDLGHTPFGHAGERALNELFVLGFNHFEQSVRVVEKLEKNGAGLNLTYEVKDGILCHTRGKEAETLEGAIIRYADKIAYINHDIDDAIRGNIISEADIPKEYTDILGDTKSKRINTLVTSIIVNSDTSIKMQSDIAWAFDRLHEFMFSKVYTNPVCKSEEKKVEKMLGWMYNYFISHPEELPQHLHSVILTEGIERAACDYIAGMTDRFCVNTFNRLFVPGFWVDFD